MSALSEQYAVALFELALEKDEASELENAYATFIEGLDEEARTFFRHPGVRTDKKKAVIDSLEVPALLKNFLFLLLDKNRFDELDAIYESYKTIRSKADEEMHMVVYSKKPLTEKRLEQLKEAYAKKYNRTIFLENRIDESILGGLRFEFDGKVIDDTINSTLKQFKSRLTK
ncbi:MAG: ATP synthase F1 subunit delta [Bacillota bacterium]